MKVTYGVKTNVMGLQKIRMSVGGPKGKAAVALFQECLIEAKESMARTPVRWGILRGSTQVTYPEEVEGTLQCKIVVGGPAGNSFYIDAQGDSGEEPGYALYVHEDLEAYHPVGQAKFLESTVRESEPYFGDRIGARLKLNDESE